MTDVSLIFCAKCPFDLGNTHPWLGPEPSRHIHLLIDRVRPQSLGVVVKLATQIGTGGDQVEGPDRVSEDIVLLVQGRVGLVVPASREKLSRQLQSQDR